MPARLVASRSAVVLREAQPHDEAELAKVEQLTLGSSFDVYRYQNILRRGCFYEQATTIVGGADGKLVCAISVALKPMSSTDGPRMVGHLFGLRVIPEARRQGMARRLRDAAEAWLSQRGVTDVYMLIHIGNRASLNLFAEAGYATCGSVSFVTIDQHWGLAYSDHEIKTGELLRQRAYEQALSYTNRPLDLDRIFSSGDDGPYLGTFALSNAAGHESMMSLWDKDAMLNRRRSDGRTVFAFDARVSDPDTWRRLVATILSRFPDIARLMLVIPEAVGITITDTGAGRLDRTEFLVAKGGVLHKGMERYYVDVRD